MKIAIISDFNIGGIPTYLMRAINKYTEHQARCIIAYDDAFAFDRDIVLNSTAAKEEAADWVNQCDFFHFGRGIFNWPGADFNNLVNRNNCCIEYYGSELRSKWASIASYHQRTGIVAITGTDWTITGRLPGSFYHFGQYFTRYGDMEENDIPFAKSWNGEGNFKIAIASAGSPLKGYDFLYGAASQLASEGFPVEIVTMSQINNDEVLERKRDCHATFTSLHGGWGMSGEESMFLGHPIICSLDPWAMGLYPNNPTVIVGKSGLKEKIFKLVQDQKYTFFVGADSRKFAMENFNTRTILKRYLYFWDLIMNWEACLEGGHRPTKIYDF